MLVNSTKNPDFWIFCLLSNLFDFLQNYPISDLFTELDSRNWADFKRVYNSGSTLCFCKVIHHKYPPYCAASSCPVITLLWIILQKRSVDPESYTYLKPAQLQLCKCVNKSETGQFCKVKKNLIKGKKSKQFFW